MAMVFINNKLYVSAINGDGNGHGNGTGHAHNVSNAHGHGSTHTHDNDHGHAHRNVMLLSRHVKNNYFRFLFYELFGRKRIFEKAIRYVFSSKRCNDSSSKMFVRYLFNLNEFLSKLKRSRLKFHSISS